MNFTDEERKAITVRAIRLHYATIQSGVHLNGPKEGQPLIWQTAAYMEKNGEFTPIQTAWLDDLRRYGCDVEMPLLPPWATITEARI